MPFFGQEILSGAEEGAADVAGVSDRRSTTCRRGSRARTGIDAVMTQYRLDALVAPTGSPAWPMDLVNGDHSSAPARRRPPLPAIRASPCPPGFAYGLPVGAVVHRPRVERSEADRAGLRLRAGDETSAAAALSCRPCGP